MPTMTEQEARRRFAAAPLAVLASVSPQGGPHQVPVTFAVDADRVLSVVDGKPKRSTRLQRHANLAAHPRAGLLVQHWDDDWSRLWWVRADGVARLTDTPDDVARATALLRRKYPQYADMTTSGPVIEVTVERWRGWRAW